MEQTESKKKTCDACQKAFPGDEINYMVLKTCCSVQRIPLCRECYAKFATKKGGSR